MGRIGSIATHLGLWVLFATLLLQHGAHGARLLSGARVQGELPPCKDVPGGIPGWDCFDPPTTDLPPCDFKHQRPGIDCWPKSPPASNVANVANVQGVSTQREHTQQWPELPPCGDIRGGIPGWDCYDPPKSPLPPCDFKHQRAGFDCWTKSPPAAKVLTAFTAGDQDLSSTESAHHFDGGMLPPCKDVWGGIPGWDCFDPHTSPLPPCDFKHQRAGFDCWPRSPPAAMATKTAAVSAAGGAPAAAHGTESSRTTDQSAPGHGVDGMLPPCGDVLGGIPGWDCYDPPKSPLPPCDFHHQRAGFDCEPRTPPAAPGHA